jgi:hypothetical protein
MTVQRGRSDAEDDFRRQYIIESLHEMDETPPKELIEGLISVKIADGRYIKRTAKGEYINAQCGTALHANGPRDPNKSTPSPDDRVGANPRLASPSVDRVGARLSTAVWTARFLCED